MQPKLLPLGKKLPPGFLSSLVNRVGNLPPKNYHPLQLSPSTYVNLRRTCSDLDEMIEDAVDRNEIHVNMKKGNSLKLVLLLMASDLMFFRNSSGHITVPLSRIPTR